MKKLYLSLAVAAACASTQAVADSNLETLVKDGSTKLDLRYRYEGVDQDGIAEQANAHTLRSRLTLNTGSLGGVSFGLEFDDVRDLNNDYNSTTNGHTEYPVVADPTGTEINQAYAKYSAGSFTALGGRQRIVLDDQRFVGGVAWRQNEQTYDGVRASFAVDKLTLDYSYVEQVNRIFGADSANATYEGEVHLLNGAFKFNDAHKLVGFYYDMAFDNAVAASNATTGLRYEGKFGPIAATASYAIQNEAGDGAEYSTDYMLADLKGSHGIFGWNVGYEILGSDDGSKGFQTPLATGHAFQGFADKFLNTPATGVEDLYAGVNLKAGPVKLIAVVHDFKAAEGSASYGQELDLVAVYPINKQFTAMFKYADYQADDFATDTQKVWLQLQMAL